MYCTPCYCARYIMERLYCNSENAEYCSTSSSIKYILHIVTYLPVNAYGTLHHLSEEKSANGAGIAQMVEHSTEKPGANAIWTWFESPVQQTFAPSVNFQCRLSESYCVHTLHSPLCALACINNCAHIKSPKR